MGGEESGLFEASLDLSEDVPNLNFYLSLSNLNFSLFETASPCCIERVAHVQRQNYGAVSVLFKQDLVVVERKEVSVAK